jgi:hypothetical protein
LNYTPPVLNLLYERAWIKDSLNTCDKVKVDREAGGRGKK